MKSSAFEIIKLSLIILIFISFTTCGGGGKSDNEPLNIYSPSTYEWPESPFTIDPPKASLELYPSNATVQAGVSFNIDIFVNTCNQNVTSVAAIIKYDPDKFKANIIDTNESIFPIENEKDIDFNNGIIKIKRSRYAPGINTDRGKIASINMTALVPTNPNSENIAFIFKAGYIDESKVVINDGSGTSILAEVKNAKYIVSQ